MMVEHHPEAAEDLNRATAQYNAFRSGLGDILREEAYGAIGRILQNPRRHRVVENRYLSMLCSFPNSARIIINVPEAAAS